MFTFFSGSGTIAGNHLTSSTPTLTNGVAPDAQLYLNDIEISCFNNTDLPTGCGVSLTVPDTFGGLVGSAYTVGTRIHSSTINGFFFFFNCKMCVFSSFSMF